MLPEALEVLQLLCKAVLLVLHLRKDLLQNVEVEGDLEDRVEIYRGSCETGCYLSPLAVFGDISAKMVLV